ncbi:MAG: methyltransferase domain-containing protein [Pusillimonas sp.]|nr:methyltransferase domain-containing protein [Pusillimonas sp.]
MNSPLTRCPICGNKDLVSKNVLWPNLIKEWELSERETQYINRQQGFHCAKCLNNFRSMALAFAILDLYNERDKLFKTFCDNSPGLSVLEINRAGNLTSFLQRLPNHQLIEYPKHDMQRLDIDSGKFDVVIHSDTLEHVPNPVLGLKECKRVLKPGGACIFTVPIIVDRLSRRRDNLCPSYHGSSERSDSDQLVYTEFGADFWKVVLEAGFHHCDLIALEYPSAMAIVAINK